MRSTQDLDYRAFSEPLWSTNQMLFLPFLTLLSRSDVIELAQYNIGEYIGRDTPIFVKFFSPHCASCKAVQEDFEEASRLFSDILFGEIDCTIETDLCKACNVSNYPSFQLFLPRNLTGISFRGAKQSHSFADFIEHHTLSKSNRPPSKVIDLNPLNLAKITNGCGIVLFYVNYAELSQSFAYSLRSLADIFEFDENIEMGTWNCAKFPDFCSQTGITEYPAVKSWSKGVWRKYNESHNIDAMLNHINHHCQTERTLSGLLNDKAGTSKEGDALAVEFLTADNKRGVLEKAKQIGSLDTYVKAMERFLEKGEEQIAKDIEQIGKLIEQRKGSIKSLDAAKKRLNVFSKFVPIPEQTENEERSTDGLEERKDL
jgi:thiol-disulfide isomerase/thioredoxin